MIDHIETPPYLDQVRDLDYCQLQKLGEQDQFRAAPPRDHTNKRDGNTGERVSFIYYATFTPKDLAEAVRSKLYRLNYDSVDIPGKEDKHHLYVHKESWPND